VEGISAPAASGDDLFEYGGYIAGDIPRGNTEHGYVARRQPFVAHRVGLGSIAHVVAHTVYLHRQPRLVAVEIEDISAGRVLAAEFIAAGTWAQACPEDDLGDAHLAP
jgi:hypothetical protein